MDVSLYMVFRNENKTRKLKEEEKRNGKTVTISLHTASKANGELVVVLTEGSVPGTEGLDS